jgi:hypothetical protein
VRLAAVYTAAGRSGDATKVQIAKERRRTGTIQGRNRFATWRRRSAHRLWGWATAFGYRPQRAVWLLVALLIAASVFYTWAAGEQALTPTDRGVAATTSECTTAYECFQPVLYAVDVMVPIVNLGQRDAWTPNPAAGEAARAVTVTLVLVGWTLTAAFIAAVGQTISRR